MLHLLSIVTLELAVLLTGLLHQLLTVFTVEWATGRKTDHAAVSYEWTMPGGAEDEHETLRP